MASTNDSGMPNESNHLLEVLEEAFSVISEKDSESSNSIASLHAPVVPNKAGLPVGVDNVRPHLEQVRGLLKACNNAVQIDNVPLLVSLFTDCEHSSTKQMLAIMQDYGEVVLVCGSSLNPNNMDVFCQADCRYCVIAFPL